MVIFFVDNKQEQLTDMDERLGNVNVLNTKQVNVIDAYLSNYLKCGSRQRKDNEERRLDLIIHAHLRFTKLKPLIINDTYHLSAIYLV